MERRWNIRLAPAPDEILTSWLHRMAIANGYLDHSFCKEMFGAQQIWNRDADRHLPQSLLATLSRWTAVAEVRLHAMTLGSVLADMANTPVATGYAPWVLPLGIYHRIRRRHGTQFCPRCLAHGVPYVRTRWRLAWVTVCPVHECLMHDRCEKCDAPFMFHRTRPWLFGVLPCSVCGSDLTLQSLRWPKSDWAGALQRRLHAGLDNGWVEGLFDGPVYRIAAFIGLRELARALTNPRSAKFQRALGLSLESTDIQNIERLGVHDRHAVIGCLGRLLNNWPDRFLGAVDRSGNLRSYVWHAINPSVHWLEQGMHALRPPAQNPLTAREIGWLRKELQSQGKPAGLRAIRRHLRRYDRR